MRSLPRTSRETRTKGQSPSSLISRAFRRERLYVSRNSRGDDEKFLASFDEDVPQGSEEGVPGETGQSKENPGTFIKADSNNKVGSDPKRHSEDSTSSHSEFEDESTEEAEEWNTKSSGNIETDDAEERDTRFLENIKTEEAAGGPSGSTDPKTNLIRRGRQKLSSTISGDRSCDSEYEQFALYLQALAHPTTDKPQSEQTVQQTPEAQAPALAAAQGVGLPMGRSTISKLRDYKTELLFLRQRTTPFEMMPLQEMDSVETQHNINTSVKRRRLSNGSSASEKRHQGTYIGEDVLGPIANALGIPSESAVSLDTLRTYISNLQQHDESDTRIRSERYQIIHRTRHGDKQRLYFDRPQYLHIGNDDQKVIAGSLPVSNLATYLSKNSEICFVVFREYDTTTDSDSHTNEDDPDVEPCPEHTAESVRLVKKSLTHTYNKFLAFSGFNTEEEAKDGSNDLEAPYYAVYNKRQHGLKAFVATLAQEHQSEFLLLVNYMLNQYSREWDEVESLMATGKITPRYIKYLFKPGEIIVHETEQGIRGYLAASWLEGPQEMTETLDYLREPRKKFLKSKKTGKRRQCNIHASSWEFDGTFSCGEKTLAFQLENDDDRELNIADLEIRPLAHSAPEVQERLRSRGLMFWKCRLRRFVSYHEDPRRTPHHSGDDRYMIDTNMYRKLRKRQQASSYEKNQARLTAGGDDLGLELMEHDEPPSDNDFPGFIYMMPMTIKGFNLKSKKWLDLKVDNIGEVAWNDEAFKSLVLKEKTKDLIQALISNQIEAEKSTDLISGKGNGLIMLLHGGPGTGKTLTAESVAEIARKPLYPVTCGDIGTEADQVEEYLESVLHIGRTWGCVVLMDEADVFLQERNLKDLQRNALVSVFLRVLEYYDGILVLTSNRVGHFDAAFKSRIQLAVRYPPLDEYQRTKIWQSFIHRLQTFKEDDIDIPDLEDHIPQLAKNKMNGREIRNAITTARQFAKWKRQCPGGQNRQLDYAMMKEIIDISGEFDRYLENELYDGNSLEQIARERLDH